MALEMSVHELRALLKFSSDKEQAKAVEKQIGGVEEKLKDASKAAEETTKKLNAMRENAEKLQQVGTTLTMAGAAITAPLLLAVRSYTQQVGKGEEASAKWAAAQERLADSQIRIGRETTKILTPLLEKGAKMAEGFADMIEKNPWIIQAALAGGATMMGVGSIAMMTAQVQRTVATVQLLTNSMNAANFATLGTKMGMLVTTLGPLALAITALTLLVKSEFGQRGTTAGAQVLTMAAGGAGQLLGGSELASKWALSVGQMTGAIEKADAATQQATSTANSVNASQMKMYLNYLQADQEATAANQKQRSALINQARTPEAQAEEEYTQSRTQKIIQNYRKEKQALADYYSERTEAVRDANDEDIQAERDHQKAMQRMAEDHDSRMQDLAINRDTGGMVREMRSAERARRDAEADYRDGVQQRNEQLATQLADMEANFISQREQRMAQFAQGLKDEAEQHEIQRRQSQKALQEQLRDLDAQFKTERNKRRQAFNEQLQDTLDAKTQERLLVQKFNAAMLADLRAAVASAQSGGGLSGSRAEGGYVNKGIYQMHDNEFVLTSKTTRAAERLGGGQSLTQDSILQLLANGGNNSKTYVDNRKFDSKLSSEARAEIRRDTEMVFGGLLG